MSNKKRSLKPLALAIGASLALSIAAIPAANANTSPFQGQKLSQGYNLADNHMNADDHAGDTAKKTDDTAKTGDDDTAKTGDNKDAKTDSSGKKDMKGKCKDGKCKAGKCAGNKDKKGGDHKCGAGKCGS